MRIPVAFEEIATAVEWPVDRLNEHIVPSRVGRKLDTLQDEIIITVMFKFSQCKYPTFSKKFHCSGQNLDALFNYRWEETVATASFLR